MIIRGIWLNFVAPIDELSLIDAIDLSLWPILEKARDLFLFDCFTGFRYSDLKNFKQEYLSGDIIRIITQKTGEGVVIPLHPIARKVLKKYNQVLPRLVNNTTFNERIKEICKLAGIVELVKISKTVGGKALTEMLPKNELVTVHTARHSFATNLYLAGIDTISIMHLTGHKTEKAFLTYIRVTKEQNAYKVANHAFFK